ncbi:hypothetical protein [Staphylococcus equorum]|uniref:hypothetical protein n=1 Tax=Staphylococcus equorum TaxID=246432 RepID=UPI003FD8F90C
MELIEQLVTLDKNDLKDITFEGQSIYELQDVIQEIGMGNENIIYVTDVYDSVTVKLRGLDAEEKQRLKESDVYNILYEEVLTLDVECNNGITVHINK